MPDNYTKLIRYYEKNKIEPKFNLAIKSFQTNKSSYIIEFYKSHKTYIPNKSINLKEVEIGVNENRLKEIIKTISEVLKSRIILHTKPDLLTVIFPRNIKTEIKIIDIIEIILLGINNQKEYITKIKQLKNMKTTRPKFDRNTIDIGKMHYKQRELYMTTIRITEEIMTQGTYENLSYDPNSDYLIYYSFKDLSNRLGFYFKPIESLENYQLNDDERYMVHRIIEKVLNEY